MGARGPEPAESRDGVVPVYLIRHAKAGDRGLWGGPDELRPLSKKGVRQARKLALRLRDVEIERVLSSPYVRCVQTVEPIARDRGLTVEQTDVLAEGASPAEALRLLEDVRTAPAVLCSHGDVIPVLVEHLAADGLSVDGPMGWRKASIWLLEAEAGRFVRARYLPPAEDDGG